MSRPRAGRVAHRIAVVTGTRAEFGILTHLCRALQSHHRLQYLLSESALYNV